MIDETVQSLIALLGQAQVWAEGDFTDWGQDYTRLIIPKPLAVVFPKTTEEVQELVRFAIHHKIALVPSGGRTGLSGGAVAAHGEVVVSLTKMDQILDFNEVEQTITCEAGVITQAVQDFAQSKGLFFPVDFASKGSSCIGGNLATNAGGVNVIRFGMTRDWVRGLTVVTGIGDIIDCQRGLIKNASGYDLRHLMIGSEGTLGLITQAILQLTSQPKERGVMLLALSSLSHTLTLLKAAKKLTLNAFEFFTHNALQHVLRAHSLKGPFAQEHPYYLLIDFETSADEADKALALFEEGLASQAILDGVLSQNTTQYQEIWQLREGISESLRPFTPYKNDVSVRVGQVAQFVAQLEEALRSNYPNFEVVLFGHIGDGNIHVNISKPADWSVVDFKAACEKANEVVYGIVAHFGGSISAEHGVGLLKKQDLHFTRSEEEIAYLRGIKQVFDPYGVLNPGKLFD